MNEDLVFFLFFLLKLSPSSQPMLANTAIIANFLSVLLVSLLGDMVAALPILILVWGGGGVGLEPILSIKSVSF
jgi:hypothetical protein